MKIDVETPLKSLRSLCERLELPKSGSKNKVLQRLKHHEVLQKQWPQRLPRRCLKTRSGRGARLASWEEADNLPITSAEDEKKMAQTKPCIQIDYCFTFTKERVEEQRSLMMT